MLRKIALFVPRVSGRLFGKFSLIDLAGKRTLKFKEEVVIFSLHSLPTRVCVCEAGVCGVSVFEGEGEGEGTSGKFLPYTSQ